MSAVTLRRAEPDDAELICAWRAEPSTSRYQPMFQHDLDTQRRILAKRRALPVSKDVEGKLQWLILCDGITAGWLSLDITSRQSALASIGYTVSEAFRGRHLASRGLRLLIDLAFDPDILALERLEANVAVENTASQRVLEASGFQREGVARGLLRINGIRVDHYRYGLLRSDFPTSDEMQAQ